LIERNGLNLRKREVEDLRGHEMNKGRKKWIQGKRFRPKVCEEATGVTVRIRRRRGNGRTRRASNP